MYFIPIADFNPRSREGSDIAYAMAAACANISIHAPARGATEYTGTDFRIDKDFNPRSRKGSDFIRRIGNCKPDISIHAPARGATLLQVRH